MGVGSWRWRGIPPTSGYFILGPRPAACSKKDDAGITWKNVSDGFFRTASVGALAVAPSDPSVLYAGMGEACIRGNVSYGDGVWRSDDAGASWRHLGLADTRHIGRVRVHPTNPDLVYVAALGHAFGSHPARGVYRSADGGRQWDLVLHRNADTGVVDLSLDAQQPGVLYAAAWDARRSPWALRSGGPGSGLFKSTDGRDHWVDLADSRGFPAGVKGRIGVACSPTRAGRVWALVEAHDGGLFRSDNGGVSWERLTDHPDLRQRPWYYMHLFADPIDPETLYVLNLGVWVSHDGGEHFRETPAPFVDNHDLWLDPARPARMILGNDGGAVVTLNGGRTWSSRFNQPTAQFYHVVTDSQQPYRVYGAQQDLTTLSVPSYSDAGTITIGDCYVVGGDESGYIAVHPDQPEVVYAGSYAARMTRYDHRSRQQVDITVWPDDPLGYPAQDLRYRFQWTFPIVLSPHDPTLLYAAGNCVFRSGDGGQSWTPISPDLTRADPRTLQSSGGPITQDNVSTEYYGTVFALAESPVEPGLLWAGSDDGLVHRSRDHGVTWEAVTPPTLPEWALISSVEPSPHDAATHYQAATRYKLDDPTPYLYRTRDDGQSWQRITAGIPDDDYTRVIREDPERPGLLYAGTETGLYVSGDGGDQWQRLTGNLPVVPVHDLTVHADDLIVATHGRAFWVLDDIRWLRDWATGLVTEAVHLFPPRPAYRRPAAPPTGKWEPIGVPGQRLYIGATVGDAIAEVEEGPDGTPELTLLTAGTNAPQGVVVRYYLAAAARTVSLTIQDATGQTIRAFGTRDGHPRGPDRFPRHAGMHQFVWDLRHAGPLPWAPEAGTASWGGASVGPVVAPGAYQIRLTVDGRVWEAPVTVHRDPRSRATDADLIAQVDLGLAIRDRLSDVHRCLKDSGAVRLQLEAWERWMRASRRLDLADAAQALRDRLREAEAALADVRSRSRADAFNYPPRLNSKLASLLAAVTGGDSRPPTQYYLVFDALRERAETAMSAIRGIIREDVRPLLNALRAVDVSLPED